MIFGLEPREPLPEGWTPLEAVAAVKCLDERGDVGLVLAATEGLSGWESVGMLVGALDAARSDLAESFVLTEEEEE